MTFTEVSSSQIHSIGYDKDAEYPLGVRFHPNKKAVAEGKPFSEYHYKDVTPEMFAAFQGAESKYRWFDANVKDFPDAFPFVRVA
jgi:hypothetical protein